MNKKFKKSLQVAFLLLITAFVNFIKAGEIPIPQPPPNKAGGPGAIPTTPIDMYQIILLVLAVILITYLYKKYRLRIT